METRLLQVCSRRWIVSLEYLMPASKEAFKRSWLCQNVTEIIPLRKQAKLTTVREVRRVNTLQVWRVLTGNGQEASGDKGSSFWHPDLVVVRGVYIFLMIYFFNCGKKCIAGLPWWRSGWESVCQCRGHRFEPWSRKIPHAAERLTPCATTTEPAL